MQSAADVSGTSATTPAPQDKSEDKKKDNDPAPAKRSNGSGGGQATTTGKKNNVASAAGKEKNPITREATKTQDVPASQSHPPKEKEDSAASTTTTTTATTAADGASGNSNETERFSADDFMAVGGAGGGGSAGAAEALIVPLKTVRRVADAVAQIQRMQRFDEDDRLHRSSGNGRAGSAESSKQGSRRQKEKQEQPAAAAAEAAPARRQLPATLEEFHKSPPTVVVLRVARVAVMEDALSGFASYVQREKSEEEAFRARLQAQRRRMEPFLVPVRHETVFETNGGVPRSVPRPVYADRLLGEWQGLSDLDGGGDDGGNIPDAEMPASLMFLMRSEDEAALLHSAMLSPLKATAEAATAAADGGGDAPSATEDAQAAVAAAEGEAAAVTAKEKRERLEAMCFQTYMQERRFRLARMPGVFKHQYSPYLAREHGGAAAARAEAAEAASPEREPSVTEALSEFLTGGTPPPRPSPPTPPPAAAAAHGKGAPPRVRREWAYVWEQFCRDLPRESFLIEDRHYADPEEAVGAVLSYLEHCYDRGLARARAEEEERRRAEAAEAAKRNFFENAYLSGASAIHNMVTRLAVSNYERARGRTGAGSPGAYGRVLGLAAGLQPSDLQTMVDGVARYSDDAVERGTAVYSAARQTVLASQQSFMGLPYQLLCEQVGSHRLALALETLMVEKAARRQRRRQQHHRAEEAEERAARQQRADAAAEEPLAFEQTPPRARTPSPAPALPPPLSPGRRSGNASFASRSLRLYHPSGVHSSAASMPSSPYRAARATPGPSGSVFASAAPPDEGGDPARALFGSDAASAAAAAAETAPKKTPAPREEAAEGVASGSHEKTQQETAERTERATREETEHAAKDGGGGGDQKEKKQRGRAAGRSSLSIPLLVGEPKEREFEQLMKIIREQVRQFRKRHREPPVPEGAADHGGDSGISWFHPNVDGSAYLLPLKGSSGEEASQAAGAGGGDDDEAAREPPAAAAAAHTRGMRVHMYFSEKRNLPLLCINKVFRIFKFPDVEDSNSDDDDDDGAKEKEEEDTRSLLLLIQLSFSLFTHDDVEIKWRWWTVSQEDSQAD